MGNDPAWAQNAFKTVPEFPKAGPNIRQDFRKLPQNFPEAWYVMIFNGFEIILARFWGVVARFGGGIG